MSKQDRQGVRLPADLERKYNFGGAFRKQRQDTFLHGEQIASLAKDVEETTEGMQEAIGGVEDELALQKEVAQGLDTDIKALSAVLSKYNIRVDNVVERIEELEATVADLQARLEVLEAE